jgi:hypothetical protein
MPRPARRLLWSNPLSSDTVCRYDGFPPRVNDTALFGLFVDLTVCILINNRLCRYNLLLLCAFVSVSVAFFPTPG